MVYHKKYFIVPKTFIRGLNEEVKGRFCEVNGSIYLCTNWNGWGEPIKDSYVINLDIDDIEGSQKRIDDYIDNNSLYQEYPSGYEEGIKINLKDLLE